MSDIKIERALGRVEGMLKMVLENQTRAEVSRKQLHEGFEALRADVADSRRRIEALERRADTVDKPIAEINKIRERTIGIILTISAIAALIGSTLAASWQKIIDIFR